MKGEQVAWPEPRFSNIYWICGTMCNSGAYLASRNDYFAMTDTNGSSRVCVCQG